MDEQTNKSTPPNDTEEAEKHMDLLHEHAKKAWTLLQSYFEEEVDWEDGESVADAFEFINDLSDFLKEELINEFDAWCINKGNDPEKLRKQMNGFEESDSDSEVCDEDDEPCYTKCTSCNAISQYGKKLCLDCWKLSKKNKS